MRKPQKTGRSSQCVIVRLLIEDSGQDVFTISEDSSQLPGDERVRDFPEGPEWQGVGNAIDDDSSSRIFEELVTVDPFPVWSSDLTILERARRIPGRDLGSPFHRESVQPDAIVDDRSRMHVDGKIAENAEVQLGRRDSPEVFSSSEEPEYFIARPWYPYTLLDDVLAPAAVVSRLRQLRQDLERSPRQ